MLDEFELIEARSKVIAALVDEMKKRRYKYPQAKQLALKIAIGRFQLDPEDAARVVKHKCVGSAFSLADWEKKCGEGYVEKYATKRRKKAKVAFAANMRR